MAALSAFRAAVSRVVCRAAGLPERALIHWVERPRVASHGDFAVPFARILEAAKEAGAPRPPPPSAIAKGVVPDDYIARAEDGGGFVNLHVDRGRFIQDVLKDALSRQELFGHVDDVKDDLVIVEFSSPNMAKPFHAGHLRSTILGNILSNLFKARGHQVLNVNYLGDWGTQYGLLSLGFQKYGDEALFEKDPIRHLYDVYVRINADASQDDALRTEARAAFARLEQGEQVETALWQRFRDLSLREYDRLYSMLGVSFDVHDGESFARKTAPKVVKDLLDSGIASEQNGAVIADLSDKKLGVVVLEKKDGASIYSSRDLAAATSRMEKYKFNRMVYVAGAEQQLHFQQVFELLRRMGHSWADTCSHVSFGLVRGMSSRDGTAVFLENILDRAAASMRSVIDENPDKYEDVSDEERDHMARQLGLAAVVVQDLSARRIKDYTFDWARMTDARGDTGVYLQYAHARLMGIQRSFGRPLPHVDSVDLSSLARSEDAFRLAVQVSLFPEVVETALERTEPSMLVHYLFDLGHAMSSANAVLRVKDQAPAVAEPRMMLFAAARIALANGLKLLGLVPLDRV